VGGQKVIPRPSADYFVVGRRQKQDPCTFLYPAVSRNYSARVSGDGNLRGAIVCCFG
jgi:hypothetical protein